jgi:CHAT domain-containing protein/tetratricopeptide (TPR) repeat protein
MFFALIMSVALLSQNRADSLHRHNHLSGHRLALEGQRQPYEEWFPNQTEDFQQPPVTLHRTMPLEVIDLEIQHQHSLFQHKKRLYEAARRLAGQGPISPWELEQARAELRFHEAQDFERTAYRALDANERGIQDGSNPPDDAREYTLLVDWLRWRRAMAEAKAELRSSRLAHDQELRRRNQLGYWDWVESKLELDGARAEVALRHAQEDWAAVAQAAWTGPGAGEEKRRSTCKIALRQASIRCSEARVARDDLLLDTIRFGLRSRLALMSVTTRSLFLPLQLAHDDALASLAAERRRLTELDIEKADPENYALALRRSIEVDDLDRAIRHEHHEVLLWKAWLDSARQLARRSAISPAELEVAVAKVAFHEALEAERIACRALIAHDRDTYGWAIPFDGVKEYTLSLDWWQRSQDLAQVVAELCASWLAQDRKLFECKATSHLNWVQSCLAFDEARAKLASIQAEQARISWKLAALTDQAAIDPTELLRLRITSSRASVRYHTTMVSRSRTALEKAEEMFGKQFITGIEFNQRKRHFDDACRALAVAQKRGDLLEAQGERNREFVRELEELAVFLRLRWDHERAKRLYEHMLTVRRAERGENQLEYARTLTGLAAVYAGMGDLFRAEPLLRQAAEINKRAVGEEHPFYAESLTRLATIYRRMGDTAQSKALLLRVLEIRKKIHGDKHPSYAESLDDLATLCCVSGDFGGAEPLAHQAAETFRTAVGEAHPYYAMGLNRLAWVRSLRSDYAGAEPLVRHALEVQKPDLGQAPLTYAESLRTLARVEQGKGNYPQAESLYRQVLEIQERVLGKTHPDCSLVLHDQAYLYYSMGDCARAESLLLDALRIDRKSLELSSAVQSERQQLRMIGKLRSGLDLYLSLATRAHSDCAAVYHELLAWKGTVFARQQNIRLARARGDSDPEVARLFAELGQVTSRLAFLVFNTEKSPNDRSRKHEILELTEEKERLERDLSQRSSAFDRQQRRWRLAPAQLQAALPPDTALIDILEYTHVDTPCQGNGKMPRERRVVAFVIRSDRAIVRVDLGPAAAIDAAVNRWRADLAEDHAAAVTGSVDPAVELRRLVWQCLERSLQGVRVVLVSPDGALARFPLAALPGQSPGSYLIEERSIALVPVPQLLPELLADSEGASGAPRSPPSLLLVGDIDFGGQPKACPQSEAPLAGDLVSRGGRLLQFASLPGTVRELTEVRATFLGTNPAGVVNEVRGAAATEGAFRRQAPGKRYLHLATHGFFSPPELRSALNRPNLMTETVGGPTLAPGRANRFGDPDSIIGFHPGLLSGLALAGANCNADRAPEDMPLDDGILTALEVAELDLSRAELVMLSACESGLGRAAGGEGLLGLQRAFQVAGARTVVASLWKVSDEATQQLMSDFYIQLWQEHLTPIEALRQAQLHMLNGSGVTSPARGVGAPVPGPVAPKRAGTHPRFWAAWVLSGYPGPR